MTRVFHSIISEVPAGEVGVATEGSLPACLPYGNPTMQSSNNALPGGNIQRYIGLETFR